MIPNYALKSLNVHDENVELLKVGGLISHAQLWGVEHVPYSVSLFSLGLCDLGFRRQYPRTPSLQGMRIMSWLLYGGSLWKFRILVVRNRLV